ncbi:MAG: hypothetical protein PVJ80_07760 [Gemmatimonadota bacterium]|jgi:hypothetical protein
MTRHDWIEGAKHKLDEWDKSLTELERKGSSVKAEAEDRYERMLDDARKRVTSAKSRVERAQDVSTDAWDDVKDELQDAWKEDKEAVNEALAELRS